MPNLLKRRTGPLSHDDVAASGVHDRGGSMDFSKAPEGGEFGQGMEERSDDIEWAASRDFLPVANR